jgi:hypothetical protein
MFLQKIWWRIQRDYKRGWQATYHNYSTLPRIVDWRFPYWALEPHPVSVHVQTCGEDWLLAAWALATWFWRTKRNWNVFIHDDGTLPDEAGMQLREIFPNVTIVRCEEADEKVLPALQDMPLARRFRASHPVGRKVFDAAEFASGPRYILLDSDVLFFRRPEEILNWTDNPNDECWFIQGTDEHSLVTLEVARDLFGVNLWPWVNTGICLMQKAALDTAFCERVLERLPQTNPPSVARTLFTLCASRHDRGGLLSPRYEVAGAARGASDVVARHYPGALRDLFYGRGLRRLRADFVDLPGHR